MLEFEVQLEMIGQYNRCEWMREWYRVMSAFWGRKFLALFIQKMDLDILEINWMCFCQMLGFHHGRHQAVCKFADQWLGDYCGFYLICPSRPIFKKPGNRTKVVAWWGLFSSNVKQDRYPQKWSIYLYELSLLSKFALSEEKRRFSQNCLHWQEAIHLRREIGLKLNSILVCLLHLMENWADNFYITLTRDIASGYYHQFLSLNLPIWDPKQRLDFFLDLFFCLRDRFLCLPWDFLLYFDFD